MAQSAASSYLLFLDGVEVPVISVIMSWQEMSTTAQITIPSWVEAEKIVPSTRVDLFQVHSNTRLFRRQVERVERGNPDEAERRSWHTTYREETARTVGEAYRPEPRNADLFNSVMTTRGSAQAVLSEMYEDDAPILRWVGSVHQTARASSASASSQTLICRGIDAQLALAKLIQLVGGHGTLTEEERRFFGQDTGNERRPNTILAGKSARAFADAIVEVLRGGDVNLAVGSKKLLGQYVQLISQPLRHKLLIDRLPSMVALLDEDSSHRRLVGDKDFKKFMRDQIAGLYITPFINVMALALSYVNYKLVPVPTPFFVPLAMATGPYTETTSRTIGGAAPRQLFADISWTSMFIPKPPPPPPIVDSDNARLASAPAPGPGTTFPAGQGPWRVFAGEVTGVQILSSGSSTDVLGFTIPASRTSWGQALNVRIRLPAGSGSRGAAQRWIRVTASAAEVSRNNPEQFREGVYVMSLRQESVFFTNFPPSARVRPQVNMEMTITVRGDRPRSTARTITTTTELETPETATRTPRIAKLNALAILPDLWWSCPPACNIIIPEVIAQVQSQPIAADAITRLVAKVQPGRSGARRSYVQTFSAPSSGDFNAELTNPSANPVDGRQWQPIEYPSGVNADISYLDSLAKHVNAAAFREYISAKITLEFWDKRLGQAQMAAILVEAPRLVLGVPALIILSPPADEDQAVQTVTQEELDLRARARALVRLLASINRALAGRGRAAPQDPSRLIRYLEQLLANSVHLANIRRSGGIQALDRNIGAQDGDGSISGFDLSSGGRSRARLEGRRSSLPTQRDIAALPIEGSDEAAGRQLTTEDLLIQSAGITTDYVVSILGAASGAAVIVPARGGQRLPSLPPASTLRAWLAQARAYRPAGDACRTALLADQAMVEAELERVRESLRELRGGVEESPSGRRVRAVLGKVVSLTESAQAGPQAPQYQISMSHVRYIQEDLNLDGFEGDSIEEAVAFGPNGYFDDMYRCANIGDKVYRPMFGCGSVVDLVREFEAGEEDALEDATADISDVRARLRSTSACSASVADADGSATSLTTVAAAERLVSEYERVYRSGGPAAAYEWWHDITARPGLHLSAAYGRGEEVGEIDGFFSESVPDPSREEPVSALRNSAEFAEQESQFYAGRHRSATLVAERSRHIDTE